MLSTHSAPHFTGSAVFLAPGGAERSCVSATRIFRDGRGNADARERQPAPRKVAGAQAGEERGWGAGTGAHHHGPRPPALLSPIRTQH